MINFLQPGDTVEITAPAGGVVAGEPVQIGEMIGIAALTKDADEAVNIQRKGVFTVNKTSGQAWAEGEPIYWDAVAEEFTTVKQGPFAGIARDVAENPSSTGSLLLCQSAYEGGFHFGVSSIPLVNDTNGHKFLHAYFDSGATSGHIDGFRLQVFATGAGTADVNTLEGDMKVTFGKANVTGVSSYMEFVGAGARVTGSCRVGRYVIVFPNAASGSGGAYSALCGSIKGGGSSGDISGVLRVACLELRVEGTFGAGVKGFEAAPRSVAIQVTGFTAGALGKVLTSASVTSGSATFLAGCLGLKVGIGGDAAPCLPYYIPLIAQADWN